MGKLVFDQIIEFCELRGGLDFHDLVDYARANNQNWFRYLSGKNCVLVMAEMKKRGWSDWIDEDDIETGIDWVAERYGMNEANKLVLKIYR